MGVGIPFQEDYREDLTRSWIDNLTNNTYLSCSDPHVLARKFITGKSLPLDVLSSFIHEATHHWCNLSLVGNTIALLEASSIQNGINVQPVAFELIEKKITRNDVSESVLTEARRSFELYYSSMVAHTLLTPLLEGLALFAELDAHSDRLSCNDLFRSVPYPFEWCEAFFGSSVAELRQSTELTKDERLGLLLWLLRFAHDCDDRKAALLCTPYGGQRGLHLQGYCLIKSLHRDLVKIDHRFKDGLLFVAFVRAWFLEDPELSGILLDRASEPKALRDILGRYLQKRMSEMLTVDTSPLIDALCEGKGESYRSLPAGAVGKADEMINASIARIDAAFLEFAVDLKNQKFDVDHFLTLRSPDDWLSRVLFRRAFLRVGAVNVTIEQKRIAEQIEILCSTDQGPVLHVRAVEPADRDNLSERKGLIELIIGTTDRRKFIVLSGEDTVIEVFEISESGKLRANDFLRVSFANHRLTQTLKMLGESNRMFNGVFHASPELAKPADDAQATISEIFAGAAKCFHYGQPLSTEVLKAFETSLRENGLAAVLGTDLVRAYAFWDTCDAYEISKRQRSQFFDKKCMKVDVVSAQLREKFTAAGIGVHPVDEQKAKMLK
jgi:hypothetical protein